MYKAATYSDIEETFPKYFFIKINKKWKKKLFCWEINFIEYQS